MTRDDLLELDYRIKLCEAELDEARGDVAEAEVSQNWKRAKALSFPIPYLEQHLASLRAVAERVG